MGVREVDEFGARDLAMESSIGSQQLSRRGHEGKRGGGGKASSLDEGTELQDGRQRSSSHLRPAELQKLRRAHWSADLPSTNSGELQPVSDSEFSSSEAREASAGNSTSTPGSTRTGRLSLESEHKVTESLKQLCRLETPLVHEIARRLASKLGTPLKFGRSLSNLGGRYHPYSDIHVGDRWREIQGLGRWQGLLDPIDPVLRAEIVRYGEFAQACYDSFDGDMSSRYCGSCKYKKEELLEKVGLENRGYEITQFLYATADLDIPDFFAKSFKSDTWSKDSNWIGFVAVSTSPEEIARLGRRDIVVAWRGTVTRFEWIKDLQDFRAPSGFDPRHGRSNVMVENGFLSVYASKNENSRYNKNSARQQVQSAVQALVDKYKDEKDVDLSITVVGHSLGSALATLCAYDLAETNINLRSRNSSTVPESWSQQEISKPNPNVSLTANEARVDQGTKSLSDKFFYPEESAPKSEQELDQIRRDRIPVTVFSFAGPRVGNRSFKERVDGLGVAVLRVVNTGDFVPELPGFAPKLLSEKFGGLMPVFSLFQRYKHVGVKLEIDHRTSPYLDPKKADFKRCHTLEAYLHVMDGYQGSQLPFDSTLRDYALVNKRTDFLRRQLYIPVKWWQEENKGLQRDKDGHWTVPVRDPELFPSTPTQSPDVEDVDVEEEDFDKDGQDGEFWDNVAIAAKKSSGKFSPNVPDEGAVEAKVAAALQGNNNVSSDWTAIRDLVLPGAVGDPQTEGSSVHSSVNDTHEN